ncbi:hypothetical protein CLV58_12536 [Spirosoma oryzae]|uniref:Uncharacterized protein n=1 Tax=Spirosoma oryzae TaxID=1469603 RepID=A0A2T0S8L1_9BACT|nr:hypothetical protein CLV58_12536 [Spirosoma oryzae]
MALDARVVDVVEYMGGITITLEDRESGSNERGQSRMEILNHTVVPRMGDLLWGGSDSATLESGGVQFPYVREGYTKLRQNW